MDGTEIAEHHGPHHLEGLYRSYKPDRSMWETYQMLEKATLIGLLTFVDRGSVLQSLIGVTVSNFMLLATARAAPYTSMKTNVLAIFGKAMVTTAYYSSVLLKVDLDDRTPQQRAGRSRRRERSGYIIEALRSTVNSD